MTITENLGALGSWTVPLSSSTPAGVLKQIDGFGHIAIWRGIVDVTASTDSDLLRSARYVGVLREKQSNSYAPSGAGMLFWLGDEDHKGHVLENKLVLTNASLTACLTAVLPSSVHLGTVHNPGGTYTGTHQWQTSRDVLDIITAAFGVEYRVNGDGTMDVGTSAQLYNITAPTAIVSARGAGADMDLKSIGATFDNDTSFIDYSTRIVMVGQSTDASGASTQFATGSADAATVPYKDLFGNTVQMTRMISDSGQTTSSVAAVAQLQLNRFNRTTKALKVTASDYEMDGTFVVGDNAWVYDPDNGISDSAQELTFRGEVINPVKVRISGVTWPVSEGHTVAFRTQNGVWIDLTRWVAWETGTNEVTVGDLPKTLTSSSNPVLDRQDAAPDASIPNAPTGLTLTTTSVQDSKGKSSATISASWTAPAQNTDGSVITDLSYYVVQYRWHGRAPLWDTRQVAGTSIDIPGLSVGLVYDVQVYAVDLAGNTGAPTAVVQITAAPDQTAPNPPSDPAVTSYLGQLRIAWDGKDNTGAAMPPDFSIVEVHVSATTGFTPVSGPGSTTLVSQLSTAGVAYATAPYGSPRYVKLVSVDNSGNRSAPSGQVTGTTAQVADGDVASLSVGKLTAGTMSADVVIGGRFATALTGARVEVNSLGFQKFASDGVTKLISLTGTEALLTGVFMTASTGRRIEVGSGGAAGEIKFLAPDGTLSYVFAYTETTGIEAIQFGVLLSGGGASPLWNRINYNNDHQGWANYRANRHEFVMGGPNGANGTDGSTWAGDFNIMTTSNNGASVQTVVDISPRDGSRFFGVAPWNGTTPVQGGSLLIQAPNALVGSAFLTYWTPTQGNGFNYGGMQFFSMDSPGSNERIEFKHWDASVWIPVWASAFTVGSDAATKTQIRAYEDEALSEIRKAKVHRYTRKAGKNSVKGSEEIGLLAHEAPAQIVTLKDGAPHGVDLYQYATLLLKGIQEIDERLLAIERKAS